MLLWIRSHATTRDHPATRRHDVTSVELAASHHEVAVDPLRWFADFAMGKHWHSVGCLIQTVARAAPDLIHRWNVRSVELARRGRHGGAGQTDLELR